MVLQNIFSNTGVLRRVILLLVALASAPTVAQQWTLESSVRQAVSTSPELKKSVAEVGARQADIKLSNLWPDPEIGFQVDNKMGKDDGAGGYDLTDVTVTQAIPLSRIKYQKEAAEANLKAARYLRTYQSLQVQNRVAQVFHKLQFASAKSQLAEQRLKFAETLNEQGKKNSDGVVVRYLTPLEKMRLNIIREEARQATANAEGKHQEALSEFVKLLGIEMSVISSVAGLQPVLAVPDIEQLTVMQSQHAQLSSQQQKVLAANHNIDVARSSQMIDPSIGLSWQRDTLSIGRSNIYAIMFNIQIPISDRKNTAESKATYKASQQKIELQLMKRELRINLNRSYMHMNHVIEQAAEYKEKVLKPSSKMLELTNRGFASGELNVLSLVDANNTYFDSRLTYLDLLYQARAELADVKLYAGQLIVDIPDKTQSASFSTGGE